MDVYIYSQFGYCPLVWMIHSRYINNEINRSHVRALGILCMDKFSTVQNLLEKDKAVKIHVISLSPSNISNITISPSNI